MKYKLSVLALMSALSFANVSQAKDFEYIPYIGMDYSYVDNSSQIISPHYNVGSFNLGTKYNDYFGTELFYQQSDNYNKKIPNSTNDKFKTSYRAYGLDLNAYLPLGCYHTFELFATAGIGEYVFREKAQSTFIVDGVTKTENMSRHNSAIGYRWGGGLIYNISENLSLKATVRYVNLDRIADYDHMTEYSLGLRYYFL